MHGPSEDAPRRVRVEGRDDTGVVIDGGKNIGSFRAAIYCVGVHFPATGEVVYYDAQRVIDVAE